MAKAAGAGSPVIVSIWVHHDVSADPDPHAAWGADVASGRTRLSCPAFEELFA